MASKRFAKEVMNKNIVHSLNDQSTMRSSENVCREIAQRWKVIKIVIMTEFNMLTS